MQIETKENIRFYEAYNVLCISLVNCFTGLLKSLLLSIFVPGCVNEVFITKQKANHILYFLDPGWDDGKFFNNKMAKEHKSDYVTYCI
jgi:hypothetical protein